MEFDKSKILTAVTADQAKIGQKGWFADDLKWLRNQVENNEPTRELACINPDYNKYRFKPITEIYGPSSTLHQNQRMPSVRRNG